MSDFKRGVGSQGAAKRSFDKRGLRMWVANAINTKIKSPLTAVRSMMGSKGVSSPKGADSNTKRTSTS